MATIRKPITLKATCNTGKLEIRWTGQGEKKPISTPSNTNTREILPRAA